jgi:hypothetical protein
VWVKLGNLGNRPSAVHENRGRSRPVPAARRTIALDSPGRVGQVPIAFP